MFENVLHQNAIPLLKEDIKSGRFPNAVLFAGAAGTGKLTSALEAARVLSCSQEPFGKWSCTCPSCKKHKSLLSSNLMMLGSRDFFLEIAAAKKAFATSAALCDSHLDATRHLFLRAVRKLQNRFHPVLWKGSDKLSKIASLTSEIDEHLEELDFEHELPESKKVESLCEKISALCQKLESEFLYDAIPIFQIRNLSDWIFVGAAEGKKVAVIEGAERMQEGSRNALLKILEEPPKGAVFILTAAQKNAVMPTILSRVRTYNFSLRSENESAQIVERVFHDAAGGGINSYLEKFLPANPDLVKQNAKDFFECLARKKIPDIASIVKNCGKFEVRILWKIFLCEILDLLQNFFKTAAGTQAAWKAAKCVQVCYDNVRIYNQNVQAALEALARDVAAVVQKMDFEASAG